MEALDTKAVDSSQPSEDSPTSSAQVPNSCAAKQQGSSEKNKAEASTKLTQDQERYGTEISQHDVLLGRGGGTNRHQGNIDFRDLVSSRQPAYVQAKKLDKTLIAKSIVANIRENNGRFLKKEKGAWVDVGDRKATEKTSQALREGLSGRMREIVKEGGLGLSKLRKIGYSVYEDDITKDDVQRRIQSYEKKTGQNICEDRRSNYEDERKPPSK